MKTRFLVLFLILAAALLIWSGSRTVRALNAANTRDERGFIQRTKSTEREAVDPGRERNRREAIAAAVARWHEELWEKFPQMRPEYRDVADAENGYLQFLLLLERAGEARLPQELKEAVAGDSTWDGAAFGRWLDENRSYVEEILRVAELPDQSAKDVDPERLFGPAARYGGELGPILAGAARLAYERGDKASALRTMKAALSLGDHISGIETPTALGKVIAVGYEAIVWSTFCQSILPSVADDPDSLRQWKMALAPRESAASSYSRAMIGEWNAISQMHLLPGLLDRDGGIPEFGKLLPPIEEFAPAFRAMQEAASKGVLRNGAERFDVEGATLKIPPRNYSGATSDLLEGVASTMNGLAGAFGVMATRRAMNQAAISILLGEEPPTDPVSGKAFLLDPAKRTLAAPGDSGGIDPIQLP